MDFYKITLITVLFFGLSEFALSDDIIVNKQFEGVQEVTFNPRDKGYEKITNVFLQKISKANNKLRAFTSYNIKYVIDVNIKNIDDGYSTIELHLNKLSIVGDINYRDFNIDDILFPSRLNLDLHLSVDDDHHVLNFDTELSKYCVKNHSALKSKPVKAYIDGDMAIDISIDDVTFYYEDRALQKFKVWEGAFNSYYQSVENVDLIKDILDKINPYDPNRLINDEFRYCKAERLFWGIYHAPFRNILDLNNNDPAGFMFRFETLQDSIMYYRQLFNYRLSNIDELFYEQGAEQLKINDKASAEKSFKRAVKYNPAHVLSHLSIAKIYLANNEIDEAADIVSNVLINLHPTENYFDSTAYYIDKVIASYFDKIDSLNQEEKFIESLKILEKTNVFCDLISILDCSPELYKRYKLAHTGIYDSYLEVIDRAMTSIRHNYAIIYIEHAIDYQKEHYKFVKEPGRVYDYLQIFIEHVLESGRKNYVAGNFRKAEKSFEKILQLCKKYPAIDCAGDVSEYLALAAQARQEHDLFDSVITFDEPLPEFKDKDRIAMIRKEMLETFSDVYLKAWAGETDQARKILEGLTEKSILYGLRKDSLINKKFDSLSNHINQKECEIAEREYNSYVDQYFKLVDQKNFPGAKEKLNKAEEVYYKTNDCNIDIDIIYAEKKTILPAVKYQEKMVKANQFYCSQDESDYRLFMLSYNRVDSFYYAHNIERYGLKHKSLFEFVKNSSDNDLISYGVSFYAGKKLHDEALDLLFRLKELEVDRENTADIQKYAGKMAAKYLSDSFPDTSSRKMIQNLNGNNRWLRYYNRAFRRNWEL